MANIREIIDRKPWVGWVLFLSTAVVIFFLGLLASSVMERRTEALYIERPVIQIDALEPRSEVWGLNYPKEYETWLETRDTTFGGSSYGPGQVDVLENYPNLAILWAGYAFAWDYSKPQGHYYAISDIRKTLRTGAPNKEDPGKQPATCWTCKSSDVPRLMNKMGVVEFYTPKWSELGGEVVNGIGCADCHDEKTMNLKITRPALVEAFGRMGKDITKATHNEMRSLVCAQCHVEYYFNKKKPVEGVAYLTFPWDQGTDITDMEKYYDNIEFSDWTHALSKAPMLKAQHPDFEIFQTSIHAKRGVTCADCHMPYKSEGGVKFTDHRIQSPLNNIANSCQVCHRQSEDELRSNVISNMSKTTEARLIAEENLAKAHLEAKFVWELGATDEQMQEILQDIRHAQWRWDFAAASNGAGAHSPTETLRLLSTSISKSQEARIKLARLSGKLGHTGEIPLPDISTKAKAQAYIGLDMPQMVSAKKQFIQTVVPQWIEQAKARQSQMTQYPAIKTSLMEEQYKADQELVHK